MMIFACVNKATFNYLQSLGKALASPLLSRIREAASGVGFSLLLPLFWQLDSRILGIETCAGLPIHLYQSSLPDGS